MQRELAHRIDSRQPLTQLKYVAGADISYNKYDPTMYATVLVYRVADGEIVEAQDAVATTTFPYVPGLLTFREAPVYLRAFAKLRTIPDVVMIDGQGMAHPRRIGLASHVGLWLGVPTLGCAKSLLCGEFREPKPKPGSMSMLKDRGEQIGYAVRTKPSCKPVFVSVGHRIDLASAVRVVLTTARGYRICGSMNCAGKRLVEGSRNPYHPLVGWAEALRGPPHPCQRQVGLEDSAHPTTPRMS